MSTGNTSIEMFILHRCKKANGKRLYGNIGWKINEVPKNLTASIGNKCGYCMKYFNVTDSKLKYFLRLCNSKPIDKYHYDLLNPPDVKTDDIATKKVNSKIQRIRPQ